MNQATRTTCIRCTLPEATAEDVEIWGAISEDRQRPLDWPDDEGSHLCWREVANGDCYPIGPTLRVTAGRLVLHDDAFTLLSAPVDDVVRALQAAGVDLTRERGASPTPPRCQSCWWWKRGTCASPDLNPSGQHVVVDAAHLDRCEASHRGWTLRDDVVAAVCERGQ